MRSITARAAQGGYFGATISSIDTSSPVHSRGTVLCFPEAIAAPIARHGAVFSMHHPCGNLLTLTRVVAPRWPDSRVTQMEQVRARNDSRRIILASGTMPWRECALPNDARVQGCRRSNELREDLRLGTFT
jgi:hypothetical protein